MYYRLYTALGWLLLLVAMPFFVPYGWLTGRHLAGLRQRFGLFTVARPWRHDKRLWFHAASVGEVQATGALIDALQRTGLAADLIVTCVTEQGLLAAKRKLGEAALCLYAPIDLPWVVERFLDQLVPTTYVCLETELWPTMLRRLKAHGIPALLLNGRLSAGSFRRYRRLAGFARQVLASFDEIAVCQEVDRERYLALGVEPGRLHVQGNAKYDLDLAALCRQEAALAGLNDAELPAAADAHYRRLLGLGREQPLLVAGSTHTGEEDILLAAFTALRAAIPDLVLIVAPRHLGRLGQLSSAWQARGLRFQTMSQARAEGRQADILLLDGMGELARLYAVATYAFCGGSLVAKGGHNIMEPAAWGKPPFYGPDMHDFADARRLLEDQGAGFTVADQQGLIDTLLYFHRHQHEYQQAAQRALTISRTQKGAAGRQAEMIRQALDRAPRHKHYRTST